MEEAGLSYEHRIVGGKYGGLDDPTFVALTPVRRVPVLQDGDVTLWESHVILRYLAGEGLTPIADMWMEFGSTTLQPPFIGMFWQRVRMTPDQQDSAVLAKHEAALNDGLAQLEAGLADQRDFVTGASFSMADIALGSLFHRITDLYPDILGPYPAVSRWHQTIAKRGGYQRWVATSYDELKVTS